MLTVFTIIDCRLPIVSEPLSVTAYNPEDAARQALSLELMRSGLPKEMVCRVYWQEGERKSMVRLYRRSAHKLA
jgi:hypothetical protein